MTPRSMACYIHACLCYVSGQQMTNTSLRERFGLAEADCSSVSRFIGETLQAGMVMSADPSSKSRKFARYLPF